MSSSETAELTAEAGDKHTTTVEEMNDAEDVAVPNLQSIAEPEGKFVPVIVTCVDPAMEPEEGETDTMVGANT